MPDTRTQTFTAAVLLVSAVAVALLAACTPKTMPAKPPAVARTATVTVTADATEPVVTLDATTSQTATKVPSPPDPSYRLVLDSEFNGSSVDSSKWLTRTRWSRVPSKELEYYSTKALKVSGGNLKITATHKASGGRDYTSGAICTYGKFAFKYGYTEIRARVPKGAGLWPAFWIASNGDTKHAEIDIMEMVGQAPDKTYLVLHYADYKGDMKEVRRIYDGPDFSQDFHTWGLDWTPDHLVWYVDGVEEFRVDKKDETLYDLSLPSDQMYVIANLAVGGWAKKPAAGAFPAQMQIDYIRVYQKK